MARKPPPDLQVGIPAALAGEWALLLAVPFAPAHRPEYHFWSRVHSFRFLLFLPAPGALFLLPWLCFSPKENKIVHFVRIPVTLPSWHFPSSAPLPGRLAECLLQPHLPAHQTPGPLRLPLFQLWQWSAPPEPHRPPQITSLPGHHPLHWGPHYQLYLWRFQEQPHRLQWIPPPLLASW